MKEAELMQAVLKQAALVGAIRPAITWLDGDSEVPVLADNKPDPAIEYLCVVDRANAAWPPSGKGWIVGGPKGNRERLLRAMMISMAHEARGCSCPPKEPFCPAGMLAEGIAISPERARVGGLLLTKDEIAAWQKSPMRSVLQDHGAA